jgi:hypothetical protein
MLKWAMRIVAVGGALLAMAVVTAAWMHRTQGRVLYIVTPTVCAWINISPLHVGLAGWLRVERDSGKVWKLGRYGEFSRTWDNSWTESAFRFDMRMGDFGKMWHGFGLVRGNAAPPTHSYTQVLFPTWALIGALLLPSGLWAGIGWRQRVTAGHCTNCGYDLRATPEICPECGREVKTSAERWVQSEERRKRQISAIRSALCAV